MAGLIWLTESHFGRVPSQDLASGLPSLWSDLVDLNQLSDRAYLAEVGKRPGLFVGGESYHQMTSFLEGYAAAAARCGRPLLDGWRGWLVARRGSDCEHHWAGQVLHIALPEGWENIWQLPPEAERRALCTLFELLDEFLAERESASTGAPAGEGHRG